MKNQSPLLLRVMTRFGEVTFKEAFIPPEKGREIYGTWEPSGIITVNPIPQAVDTIIHELLHEMFPNYKENAIRSLTGKLMKQLSDDEMQVVYEEYKRRVQLSDRLQKIEDEK